MSLNFLFFLNKTLRGVEPNCAAIFFASFSKQRTPRPHHHLRGRILAMVHLTAAPSDSLIVLNPELFDNKDSFSYQDLQVHLAAQDHRAARRRRRHHMPCCRDMMPSAVDHHQSLRDARHAPPHGPSRPPRTAAAPERRPACRSRRLLIARCPSHLSAFPRLSPTTNTTNTTSGYARGSGWVAAASGRCWSKSCRTGTAPATPPPRPAARPGESRPSGRGRSATDWPTSHQPPHPPASPHRIA